MNVILIQTFHLIIVNVYKNLTNFKLKLPLCLILTTSY